MEVMTLLGKKLMGSLISKDFIQGLGSVFFLDIKSVPPTKIELKKSNATVENSFREVGSMLYSAMYKTNI